MKAGAMLKLKSDCFCFSRDPVCLASIRSYVPLGSERVEGLPGPSLCSVNDELAHK